MPRPAWIPVLALFGALSLSAFRKFDLAPPVYEQRNDFRSVARYVGAHAKPGDVVATWGPQARYGLEYYHRRYGFAVFPSFIYPGTDGSSVAAEFAALPEVKELDTYSREHRRIWFLLDRDVPFHEMGIIPHFFLRRLGMGHRLVSETHYRGAILYEFEAE